MSVFLFDKTIFGPVYSRRLGISLGINLLPNDAKICNFDCIYCECGWSDKNTIRQKNFQTRQTVAEELEKKLKNMQQNNASLDVITFAGNGEPTIHPDFSEIIEDTIKLRNQYFPQVKISVLTNATTLSNQKTIKALQKIELPILKLDSAYEETIKKLNQPLGNFSLAKLIKNLKDYNNKLIIQTLFVKGTYNGKTIDNTTEKEITAWLKLLKELSPEKVMIYTIARDTPVETLEKIPIEKLKEIAQKTENEGIKTNISG